MTDLPGSTHPTAHPSRTHRRFGRGSFRTELVKSRGKAQHHGDGRSATDTRVGSRVGNSLVPTRIVQAASG